MQILESSVLGLRSAVLTLRRKDTPLRFLVFPMVHIGEQAFYDAVTERLRACDLIVAEGVKRGSADGSWLRSAYAFAAAGSRLQLVVQSLDLDRIGVPAIWPDMTREELKAGFKRIPIGQRLMIGLGAPVALLGLRWFDTRELLGSVLALDDLPTLEQEALYEGMEEFEELLVDQRDKLVVDALFAIHEERHHEPITVAVVYGAGHVPGIVRALFGRYRYIPQSAEWLAVFEY